MAVHGDLIWPSTVLGAFGCARGAWAFWRRLPCVHLVGEACDGSTSRSLECIRMCEWGVGFLGTHLLSIWTEKCLAVHGDLIWPSAVLGAFGCVKGAWAFWWRPPCVHLVGEVRGGPASHSLGCIRLCEGGGFLVAAALSPFGRGGVCWFGMPQFWVHSVV